MRVCALCQKNFSPGDGMLFSVPKDPELRANWEKICCRKLVVSSKICSEHFESSTIAHIGQRVVLLPNAKPLIQLNPQAASQGKRELFHQEESPNKRIAKSTSIVKEPNEEMLPINGFVCCNSQLLKDDINKEIQTDMPKDADRRQKWNNICKMVFPPNVSTSDEKTTYEERCMPLEQPYRENESVADFSNSTDLNMWLPCVTEIDPLNIKSFKDQQTQTVGSNLEHSYTMLKQCKEKIRQLETDNKELKCKLAQANLAVDAMRKIFTEGQIRKLMSPGIVHWSWEDITNAIYLHECGPEVYNHLYNKGFPLPHYNTLRRWCEKIDKQTADMPLSEEICTLSSDENKDEQIFECGSSDDDGTTTSSIS